MFFEFNGQRHGINQAGVKVSSSYELDDSGEPWLELKRFDVDFMIHNEGTTSKDLDPRIAQVESMYDQTSNAGGLLHDDGTPTKHYLSSGETLGGLRVISRPSYQRYQRGEYVTYRTGVVTIEAAISRYDDPLRVVEWTESIDVQDSGEVHGMLQPNFGNAIRQKTRTNQFATATQSGRIVYAESDDGPIPEPYWDYGQVGPVRYQVIDPRRFGGLNTSVRRVGYAIDYTYEFEWPTSFDRPRLRP